MTIEKLKAESFKSGSEIVNLLKCFPDGSPVKVAYEEMLNENEGHYKIYLQNELRIKITPGPIDVNIMTKCDRINYDKNGEALPVRIADAMSALRGFAESDLSSSVIFYQE